jgi:hypothetical protein
MQKIKGPWSSFQPSDTTEEGSVVRVWFKIDMDLYQKTLSEIQTIAEDVQTFTCKDKYVIIQVTKELPDVSHEKAASDYGMRHKEIAHVLSQVYTILNRAIRPQE